MACHGVGGALWGWTGRCATSLVTLSPYLPVRDLLRQLWGLPDAAPAPTLTATVQLRLREAGVASEDEALVLLQLLDVPIETATVAQLSPQAQRTRTFALLQQMFLHASQRQPLVLAVEDGFRLHRLIDPETTSPDSFFRAIGDLQRAMGISPA